MALQGLILKLTNISLRVVWKKEGYYICLGNK